MVSCRPAPGQHLIGWRR